LMTLFLMPTLYYIFNKNSDKKMEKKRQRTLRRIEKKSKKDATIATTGETV